MKKSFASVESLLLIILAIFSFFVNYYYANIGVYPIDTFAFFDTAYNILIDRHPFKDIWVTTGFLVDYFQAFFFKLLGVKWSSYVIHGSLFNLIITVAFYLTLINFKFDKYISFLYALAFSILCYTISATPFAYIHSLVLSFLSFLFFILAIKNKSEIFFFCLPVTMLLSFLCMQTPSTYVNIIILFGLFFYFINFYNSKLIMTFFLGSLFVLVLFLIFISFYEISIIKIYQQYILFPLSMGEYRLSTNNDSQISLLARLTFRNLVGHFKFINIFIVSFALLTFYDLLKKKIDKEWLIINISIIFLGITLIFNQLITSNQTYIFSLIPFMGAFFHIYVKKRFKNVKIVNFIIFSIIIFSSLKYHFVYNEQRKFMDLQNVNLSESVDAAKIDIKLKGLKWITPSVYTPNEEIDLILETLASLKKENQNKMVLTHYQFFSLLLEENLNIPNRWYSPDNISYPLKGHKYFEYYKNHFSQIIEQNKINIIYTVGDPVFENFLVYLQNVCFDKKSLNKMTNIYTLNKCN